MTVIFLVLFLSGNAYCNFAVTIKVQDMGESSKSCSFCSESKCQRLQDPVMSIARPRPLLLNWPVCSLPFPSGQWSTIFLYFIIDLPGHDPFDGSRTIWEKSSFYSIQVPSVPESAQLCLDCFSVEELSQSC